VGGVGRDPLLHASDQQSFLPRLKSHRQIINNMNANKIDDTAPTVALMPISDVLVSPRNQNFAVEIKYYSCNTTT